MKQLPVVEVWWVDSASNDEWQEPDIEMKVAQGHSVGFLKEKSKRQVVLLMTQGETQIQGLLAIPRSCVKKMRKLT